MRRAEKLSSVVFFCREVNDFARERTPVRAPARRVFRPTNVFARRLSSALWRLSRAHDAEPPPFDRLTRASRLARARLSVTRRPRESHRGHGAVPSRQGPGQGQFRHRDARDQGGEPLREIRRGTSHSPVASVAALPRRSSVNAFFLPSIDRVVDETPARGLFSRRRAFRSGLPRAFFCSRAARRRPRLTASDRV